MNGSLPPHHPPFILIMRKLYSSFHCKSTWILHKINFNGQFFTFKLISKETDKLRKNSHLVVPFSTPNEGRIDKIYSRPPNQSHVEISLIGSEQLNPPRDQFFIEERISIIFSAYTLTFHRRGFFHDVIPRKKIWSAVFFAYFEKIVARTRINVISTIKRFESNLMTKFSSL